MRVGESTWAQLVTASFVAARGREGRKEGDRYLWVGTWSDWSRARSDAHTPPPTGRPEMCVRYLWISSWVVETAKVLHRSTGAAYLPSASAQSLGEQEEGEVIGRRASQGGTVRSTAAATAMQGVWEGGGPRVLQPPT